MDQANQTRFRKLIQDRLSAIDQDLKENTTETEAISPDVAIGRLSRLDSMQMQQMALASKRRLEQEKTELHDALRRVDRGTYGICLLCNKPIAEERLEYQLTAQACVECLRKGR
jgi:DnaK suppressor protein